MMTRFQGTQQRWYGTFILELYHFRFAGYWLRLLQPDDWPSVLTHGGWALRQARRVTLSILVVNPVRAGEGGWASRI